MESHSKSHSKVAIWVLVMAASLALAIALHELVEKPARRHLLARWVPQH